jgi:hypothetical protein
MPTNWFSRTTIGTRRTCSRAHQPERVVKIMVGGECNDISRRHVANHCCVGVEPATDDTDGHVTVGDDSDQPLWPVDYRQRADVFSSISSAASRTVICAVTARGRCVITSAIFIVVVAPFD